MTRVRGDVGRSPADGALLSTTFECASRSIQTCPRAASAVRIGRSIRITDDAIAKWLAASGDTKRVRARMTPGKRTEVVD